MNSKDKKIKLRDFNETLKEELKNPEFKKWYDYHGRQLDISLAIIRLRKKQGLTQAQLAKQIGTSQSNVARMEAGQQNFTIETLDKIANVFGRELKVEFC